MNRLEYDHIALMDRKIERELIAAACGDSMTSVVYLAPLDKGLSGSTVWQARWRTESTGRLSDLQVFKIGNLQKLEREERAVAEVADPIDSETPQVRLFRHSDPGVGLGLLRSRFVGETGDTSISLCDHLRRAADVPACESAIDGLYSIRMKKWHYANQPNHVKREELSQALDWWMRDDIPSCAKRVGAKGILKVLRKEFGVAPKDLDRAVQALKKETRDVAIGPVHGDLHSQNVLVDSQNKMHLIDFGWTSNRWRAIDFLMLECSLKFLVAPIGAQLSNLLWIDKTADHSSSSFGSRPRVRRAESDAYIFGEELSKVAASVVRVRDHAMHSGAVADMTLYREGLVLLTAGLSSMPHTINLPYVLLSLAHQLRALRLI